MLTLHPRTQVRAVPVEDKSAAVETVSRERASSDPGSVGAPMSGVVIEVRVKEGHEVKKGDILCVQSAMKVRRTSKRERGSKLTRYVDGERCFRTCVRAHQESRRPRGRQPQPGRLAGRDCALNGSLTTSSFAMCISIVATNSTNSRIMPDGVIVGAAEVARSP